MMKYGEKFEKIFRKGAQILAFSKRNFFSRSPFNTEHKIINKLTNDIILNNGIKHGSKTYLSKLLLEFSILTLAKFFCPNMDCPNAVQQFYSLALPDILYDPSTAISMFKINFAIWKI